MVKPLKAPTVQELADHARALASAFKISLVERDDIIVKPEQAISLHYDLPGGLQYKIVGVQVIADECRYAIALHELGHCIAPLGAIAESKTRPELILVQEEAAWEWAEYHALVWTTAMEQTKTFGLDSYRKTDSERRAREKSGAENASQLVEDLQSWKRKIGL